MAFPECSYQYDGGPEVALHAFGSILRKYGPDCRAYVGLARAQMLVGDYDLAAQSCRKALAMCPDSCAARLVLATAEQTADVVRVFGRSMNGRKIGQAIRYAVGGKKNAWLVLSSRVIYENDRQIDTHTDARLSLLRMDGHRLTTVWQSRALGPGYTQGRFDYIRLHVLDLTGDRVPEALVTETQIGASWQPSHLDVFGRRGQEMVHELGVSSDEPLSIGDLNGDRRYEISSYRFIGDTLSHSQQPLWFDIYAFKHGCYQQANGDFPRQYRPLAAAIRQLLALHPNDAGLLGYRKRIGAMHRRG